MNKSKKAFEKIVSKTKIYLAIIAILMIIICIYEINYIIPAVVIYALIIMYTYWTNHKGQEEFSEHLKNLTFSLDKVAKIALVNSPFPLIIAETNGNLIFRNTTFNEEFANIDINNYVTEILKDVKSEIKNSDKKERIVDEIQIDKRIYKIYGEYMPLKDQYVIVIYFIDNTKLIELENQLDFQDTYIGLIMIDNYDDIMQRIHDDQKPQIIAGIKAAKISEKAQFTLSIAISNEGTSNYEKYKSAQATLDIVLGRGGDQSVIKENDKYHFYGGRTQEVEKRTKVKARTVSHALEELIAEANNVMIMGHANSDIDCIGSGIGIYRLAKSIRKRGIYC